MVNIVSAKKFSLWYDQKQALFDIDFNLERNKVTSLIGASGSGKSTFLRSINRMNDLIPICSTQGEIFYGHDNIYDPKLPVEWLRSKIGMVFQKPNPFPQSIFDNVAYGLRLHKMCNNRGELEEKLMKALKQAGLWKEVKERLKESALGLSGGQQQRLCIARAIAVDPEVLLMDEPCSALDPISTAYIEELIAELAKHHTILIVTHSMQQAMRVSSNTAFFHMGHLVEYNTTEKVFSDADQERTRAYVSGKFG